MSNDLQKTREIQAFVVEESTKGTLNLTGLVGSTVVRLSGVPQYNQQPGFSDSTEMVNSRSRADRFSDAFPAGTLSVKHYVRIGNAKTNDPEHDVIYKAMMGSKTTNTGEVTAYPLYITKPSVSFLFKERDMVFACRGCVHNTAKTSLQKKGAIEFEHQFLFMELLFAGKVTFASGMTYTSGTKKIVFPTAPGDDYKKFTVGMRVKVWDNDSGGTGAYLTDGSNAFFLIDSVNSADNSITVTAAISGGWTPAASDRVDPWYPTASLPTTRILEMRSGKVYKTTAGSSAISIRSCELNINDSVKMLEEEITDSGYPEDYVEGARVVDAKVGLLLRTDDLKYFYDGKNKTTYALYIEGRDPSAPTVRTNAMQLALPKALGSVPNLSGEDLRTLDVDYAALVNAAVEDELTLKFGNLTA
jgi:hypothetical protein